MRIIKRTFYLKEMLVVYVKRNHYVLYLLVTEKKIFFDNWRPLTGGIGVLVEPRMTTHRSTVATKDAEQSKLPFRAFREKISVSKARR